MADFQGGGDRDDFDDAPNWEDDLQLDQSAEAQLAEARREADQLRRLLVDQEVRDEMAREGFSGPKYEVWVNEYMAPYAIAVLHAQLLTGSIFAFAAAKQRPVKGATGQIRQMLREDREARSDLVTLLVARTLRSFRKNALLGGQWKASGGASLATFFIGAAHLELSGTFKEWARGLDPVPTAAELDETIPTPHLKHHPDRTVVSYHEMERLIALAPPASRKIIRLSMAGYTQAEIADITGRSSQAAVEGAIYRYRQVLKNHGYS